MFKICRERRVVQNVGTTFWKAFDAQGRFVWAQIFGKERRRVRYQLCPVQLFYRHQFAISINECQREESLQTKLNERRLPHRNCALRRDSPQASFRRCKGSSQLPSVYVQIPGPERTGLKAHECDRKLLDCSLGGSHLPSAGGVRGALPPFVVAAAPPFRFPSTCSRPE